MTDTGADSPVGARVAMLLFFAVVAANAASLPYSGDGYWWTSGTFWLGRAAILISAGAGIWYIRERTFRRREMVLERAVSDRTQTLEAERLRERERNQILEMLVSNQPFAAVLDAVARLTSSQFPGSFCAILMKGPHGNYVASAPGLPAEWLAALQVPHAIPFEVWRQHLETRPEREPAWRIFKDSLTGAVPAMIRSWLAGNAESPLGALLLFYPEEPAPGDADARAAEAGCRMVRLALEHSRLCDHLRFQAEHDALTGLPNRILYEKQLTLTLSEADALGRKVAVLFVDLDHFKQINDSFSHRVGDSLLEGIARRMKAAVRPGDTVARIGGDEFTMILDDVQDSAEAGEIAARVLDAIRQPITIDGRRLGTSASVGIAMFPDDGKDFDQLEHAADAAMYHAKELGRDRAVAFAMHTETLDRARMEEELRVGLQQGYFVVYYQPKVGADRRMVGFEALLRMEHPEHGLIQPADFIPIAEASGLIVPLGAWVIEEVCRQVAEWNARGMGQVPVAVNVSPIQISRGDFASSVQQCLSRHGISPENLELELTESLLIHATGVAQQQLRTLRALGVRLSIDDFGTGYSSLSYLHRLQIDCIKLDRSFVQSIDTDELARWLVQGMVGVAQGLGLSVVAEGVETEGQRAALIAAGCPLMQGFLFAHPQPPAEMEALLYLNARSGPRSGANPVFGGTLRLGAALRPAEIPDQPVAA